MSADFYYVGKDGKPHGPIPLEDLRQLRQTGVLTDTTLVCPVGAENWTAFAADPVVTGKQAPHAPGVPPIPFSPPAARSSSTGKVFLGVGIGCLAVLILVGGGCVAMFMGIFGMLNDEPRKQEVADAAGALLRQNHPEEAAAIGLPLKPGYVYSGNIHWGTTTTYDGTMPVEGTKASGELVFDAEKPSGGSWIFHRAVLSFEGKSIDLLKPKAATTAEPSGATTEEQAPEPASP